MHHCGAALDEPPGQRASGLGTEQSPPPSQRKSWKRRFFVLDEFSISYYKCEQVSSSPRTRAGSGTAAVLHRSLGGRHIPVLGPAKPTTVSCPLCRTRSLCVPFS